MLAEKTRVSCGMADESLLSSSTIPFNSHRDRCRSGVLESCVQITVSTRLITVGTLTKYVNISLRVQCMFNYFLIYKLFPVFPDAILRELFWWNISLKNTKPMCRNQFYRYHAPVKSFSQGTEREMTSVFIVPLFNESLSRLWWNTEQRHRTLWTCNGKLIGVMKLAVHRPTNLCVDMPERRDLAWKTVQFSLIYSREYC